MMKKVLITGTSSGLGKALAQQFLNDGARVYGCSRRGLALDHRQYQDAQLDLSELDQVERVLSELLAGVEELDLVVLNAGILGAIESMSAVDMGELKRLMDINVWSNKLALDYLLDAGPTIKQVVIISSGAAVNGNKGWGAYSLSKAAINMLTKLYAAEHGDAHFIALAPGLVDTPMQDHLCDPKRVDAGLFPSVEKLRAARGTDNMPTAEAAAKKMVGMFPRLIAEYPSGDFIDVRTM